MEQRKVLLIIVSVTIVLAAIVGIGLWLFYPRTADAADFALSGVPESGGYEWQPLDYLQGRGDLPGLDESEAGGAGDTDEFEVTYGVVQDAADRVSTRPQTVIDTVEPTPSAETTGAPGPAVQPASPDSSATAVAHTTAAVASTTPATAVTETSVSPSAEPGLQAASPTTTITSAGPSTTAAFDLADQAYWVQAISSPNRDTVEQSRLTLREHQLGSRILTKVIDGRTYYRLRIGPFAVRAEAEKFLGWVQAISDFSDAMIFVDYTTPVLAARPG